MNSIASHIAEALARGDSDSLREAIRLLDPLAECLPPGDDLAQIVFDVAFRAEALCDYELCADLYRRSLDCPVQNPNIHAGSWFRRGRCLEVLGSWKFAIDSFREAIRLGQGWGHMTDHATLHLAQLLYAAEDFESAEPLFSQLLSSPIVEIGKPSVRLARARCLLYLDRKNEATLELDRVCRDGNTDEALEADRTLAGIHEAAGDRKAAIVCYQRILDHPAAENAVKAAATFRIQSLL